MRVPVSTLGDAIVLLQGTAGEMLLSHTEATLLRADLTRVLQSRLREVPEAEVVERQLEAIRKRLDVLEGTRAEPSPFNDLHAAVMRLLGAK